MWDWLNNAVDSAKSWVKSASETLKGVSEIMDTTNEVVNGEKKTTTTTSTWRTQYREVTKELSDIIG